MSYYFPMELNLSQIWCCSGQGNDDDCRTGHQECREQFVDSPDTAHRLDAIFPDKYHDASGYHACDGTWKVAALPEQGKQHYRSKGCAETGPGKGNDGKYGTVRVPCQDNSHQCNADNGKSGGPHGGLGVHLNL